MSTSVGGTPGAVIWNRSRGGTGWPAGARSDVCSPGLRMQLESRYGEICGQFGVGTGAGTWYVAGVAVGFGVSFGLGVGFGVGVGVGVGVGPFVGGGGGGPPPPMQRIVKVPASPSPVPVASTVVTCHFGPCLQSSAGATAPSDPPLPVIAARTAGALAGA